MSSSSSSSSSKKAAAAVPPPPRSGKKASAAPTTTTSSAAAAHLRTHPSQNPHFQRAPNPHLTSAMESMCATAHAAHVRRVAAQTPPSRAGDPQHVDMLDMEYDGIDGQKFVVMSFVSPTHAVRRREEFYLQEFIAFNDYATSYKLCSDYAEFMAVKYGLDTSVMEQDFKDFMAEEGPRLKDADVSTKLQLFCKKNAKELQKKYEGLYGHETSVRGLVVLGTTSTIEEARALKDDVLSTHEKHPDIYVGFANKWIPWDPENLIEREYLEPELNALMSGREVKEARKNEQYKERKDERVRQALAVNEANVAKHGGKTTMAIGRDGRPVNTTRTECANYNNDDADDGDRNLLRPLDGNSIEALVASEGGLDAMMSEARARGDLDANQRPVDAETGEEAVVEDLVRNAALAAFAEAEKAAAAAAAAAERKCA